MDTVDFTGTLAQALQARRDWLDTSELGRLKDELRGFQAAFSALYTMYLKKGLVNEDPYKQDTKTGDIEPPDTSTFSELEMTEQMSSRLSRYDTQLDLLVNFYQYTTDFFTLDRVKKVTALITCIDWANLTEDSEQPNTKAAAELTSQIKAGVDSMALRIIGDSQSMLSKSTGPVLAILKALSDYHKEAYKLKLREEVFSRMPPAEAVRLSSVRKQFALSLPGAPFYHDLAEEVIAEDYSANGPALREKALAALKVPEEKPKSAKQAVSLKTILMDGVHGLCASSSSFNEIIPKLDDNKRLLDLRRVGLFEMLKRLIESLLFREEESAAYEVEYPDPVKGTPARERIEITSFRAALERKVRTLTNIQAKGVALAKIEALDSEQLCQFLERNIQEIQYYHRILAALDEYFKLHVNRADREKVKGIRPELTAIKNALVRANQKRCEYRAKKEEEEQIRILGAA